MTLLTPAARAAIDGGHLGHLVTLDPDGTPEVTLVWIGLDGDQVVAAHLGRYRKVRNMQRDDSQPEASAPERPSDEREQGDAVASVRSAYWRAFLTGLVSAGPAAGHACCSRVRFGQPPCWVSAHRLSRWRRR